MLSEIKHEPLYRGIDLAVDWHHGGHPISLVMFEARDELRGPLKPGPFGQGFGLGRFAALGMNEFVLKCSRNHWYQTDEILDVIDAINSRSAGTRVFTYGGSMGAFAAVNFAPRLAAEKFIALSPLYDVSIGNALGDVRWAEDTAHLDFRYNFLREGECREQRGYVFYCSTGPDRAHAERIAKESRAELAPFKYGGHPISFLLNDTYGLKAIVKEITEDRFDLDTLHAVVREKAPHTYHPYEKAAADLAAAGRTGDAIASIRTAIGKNPKITRLHLRLATYLLKAKDESGAEEALKAAISAGPGQPVPHARLSHLHAERGDLEAAVEQMRIAIRLLPGHAPFHGGLGELFLKLNDPAAAEASFRRALDIDPTRLNPHVRLSRIHADRNEIGLALEHMRIALELEPKSAFLRKRHKALTARMKGDDGIRAHAANQYRTDAGGGAENTSSTGRSLFSKLRRYLP